MPVTPSSEVGESAAEEATRAPSVSLSLDLLQEAVSIVDERGGLLWANGAWEKLTGWKVSEVKGSAPLRLLHGVDTDAATMAAMQLSDLEGVPFNGDLLRYRRDGTAFWMQLQRTPTRDANGRIESIVEIGRDITGEKARESESRATRTFLASLIRAHVDGILALDRHYRLTEWNPQLERWTGLPRSLVLGDSLDEVLPVHDPATRRLLFGEVLTTDAVRTHERQYIMHSSASHMKLELVMSAIRDDATGEITGVLVQLRDVGLQHAAAEAVRRERALLEEAIAVLDSGFAMFDAHETLIACNARYRNGRSRGSSPRIGMSLSEVIALPRANDLQHDATAISDACWLARKLERHRSGGGTFEERVGDRIQRVAIARTRDGGSVVLETDISELKHVQASLEIARDAAQAANRAKSRFLASMSHELRTPLNSIIGFSRQMLKGNAGNRLSQREHMFLDRIQANGRHLLALINGILDLSKVEAGRVEVSLAPTDLAKVVHEAIHLVEGYPRSSGVDLLAVIPEGVESIVTDGGLLTQVVVNLVANALKFTRSGSVSVHLDTDDRSCPVAIRVCDTGIGIPPERLEAIFEPFEQASHTTSRDYGGTGLGLSISRTLCHVLGARLTVASVVGQGSTFLVDLQRPPAQL